MAANPKFTEQELPTDDQASTAEYAVLGSCLCGDRDAVQYVMKNVESDHFVDGRNKSLFKAMHRMYELGTEIDPVTLEGNLTDSEKRKIGMPYILELTEDVTTTLNVRHYHRIMRNRAIMLALKKQTEKIVVDPFHEDNRKELNRLLDQLTNAGQSVMTMNDAISKYKTTIDQRRAGKEFRIKTGYGTFDSMTGGLTGGSLIAVGARTSLGKTSLLLNIATKFVKQNIRTLFVTAEMVTDEILDRMTAMEADISMGKLRQGRLNEDDLARFNESVRRFDSFPMTFLEGGKMSMSRFRSAVEASNPTVVFVDFIQRFVPPNPAMNRAAYFSDLANEFKAIALDKKLIIFVASQLNRDIEKDNHGKGRPPNLSDFKESGGIEEAADLAILLQAKKDADRPVNREIIMHILKQRNGPTGRISFIFLKERTCFFEKDANDDLPGI